MRQSANETELSLACQHKAGEGGQRVRDEGVEHHQWSLHRSVIVDLLWELFGRRPLISFGAPRGSQSWWEGGGGKEGEEEP